MKKAIGLALLLLSVIVFSGCGETVHGVGRDASRIWYGTKTIFGAQ